jgi:hypothetical protein
MQYVLFFLNESERCGDWRRLPELARADPWGRDDNVLSREIREAEGALSPPVTGGSRRVVIFLPSIWLWPWESRVWWEPDHCR